MSAQPSAASSPTGHLHLRERRKIVQRSTRQAWRVLPVLVLAVVAGACASSAGASPSATALGHGQDVTKGAPIGALPNVSALPAIAPGYETSTSRAGSGPNVGSGTASAGVSIAYPYPGYLGSLGVAPENTIMAVGQGSASMKADQSDRAAAEQKAVTAAVADARRQANEVASAMNVQIDHVYSVSVSSSTQMTYPATNCTIEPMTPATSAAPAPNSVPSGMPSKCDPATQQPTAGQVSASVTVAFAFK